MIFSFCKTEEKIMRCKIKMVFALTRSIHLHTIISIMLKDFMCM